MLPRPLIAAHGHEVIGSHALHDHELRRGEAAVAVFWAVHEMRGLRRHGAALAGRQLIEVSWCAGFYDQPARQADKAVGDLAVIVPGHALAGPQAEDAHPQVVAFGHGLNLIDFVIAL